MGFLPVNAFVIRADEPVLVDTGLPGSRATFMEALRSVIDLRELSWIWLTHPDRDHLGALDTILEQAPQARLVCTFATAGYLALQQPVPQERITLIEPGESLSVGGGRRLRAFRPPLYDNPMTVGFLDSGNGACISADCFGAVLPTADSADAADVARLDAAEVKTGQAFWAGVDSPWVHLVDPELFARSYDSLSRFQPGLMLSAHLPPAAGRFEHFRELLSDLPRSAPTHAPAGDLLEQAVDAHLDRTTAK
jgi:hypothetical protein